ncbi:glycoside hydrolase family 61 protein [Suillus americanus]|nr:glycoside hydrolase family 61 protein [Suillus americanus]
MSLSHCSYRQFSLSFLALLPLVSAHGYLAQVVIDGNNYYGNVPNAKPVPSIIRQINDVSPVMGASNPYLNCGQDAQLASLVANANPSSHLQFWWKGGDGGHWPHNTGPIMTYMARCVDTTCDQYNSTNAKWFKIKETGLQPGDMVWYQQNIMDGGAVNVILPPILAPGQYLIRHEIIALHEAVAMGGAQFYPSCTQVNIQGDQWDVAPASDKVTFPGGYNDDDPGIYDPMVFNRPVQYTFPGPPVVSFAAPASNISSPTSSKSSSTTMGTPVPSSTASGNAGEAQCQVSTGQAAFAMYPC